MIEVDLRTLNNGYQRIGSAGLWHIKGVGTRFYSETRQELKAYDGPKTFSIPLVQRQVVTIRPQTENLTPYVTPGLGPEDFRGPGGVGISPYGDDEVIAVNDRIMQRCALGCYDLDTGLQRWIDDPGYDLVRFRALSGFSLDLVDGLRPYDGQHLVRALRGAVKHMDDQFVQMDVAMIAHDAELVWRRRCMGLLDEGSGGRGHPALGREFGWVCLVAALTQDYAFMSMLRGVIKHHAHARTGILQRITPESAGGMSPHPYEVSGVPTNVALTQDIEACIQVIGLQALGMTRYAERLAKTILGAGPKRKWIGTDDGKGYGVHHAAPDHSWMALGAWAKISQRSAVNAGKLWPVPKPAYMGGSAGPYGSLPQIQAALINWSDEGKNRAFLEATA